MIRGRIWGELKYCAGRHAGEECYIFGDGPSVKWFDLRLFSDKPAICCNMLPFHKDFDQLDVRYCTLTTPRYFAPKVLRHRDYLIDGQTISKEYRRLVAAHGRVHFLFHVSNYLFIRGRNVNFAFQRLPNDNRAATRLLNEFNVFSGAFYSTLALAYFLGFSRVYLVGFDAWTVQPARKSHWYEYGAGELLEVTTPATGFLSLLKQNMDIHAISVEGESNNVSCISYEKHTGKAPQFRENFELMDEHSLRMLATYPRYRIFPT